MSEQIDKRGTTLPLAWIESHTILLRHRKLIELASDLQLKPVYTMGHLHALWHAALEQQDDGDLSGWGDSLIAEYSGYDGDPVQFVALLQKHKWLDGKILHDWLEYAGQYLRSKYHNTDIKKLQKIWIKHGKKYGGVSSSRHKQGSPSTGMVRLGKKTSSLIGGNGLPMWLDEKVWLDFVDYRKKIRKPLTDRGRELAISNITKLKAAGCNPTEVIEQTIANGWTGLYEVKNRGGDKIISIDQAGKYASLKVHRD